MEKYDLSSDVIASYNFKELLSTSGKSLDYFPRLTACWGKSEVHELKFAEVEVELPIHLYDPWNEDNIVQLLGGFYVKANIVLTSAKNLKRNSLIRVLKYTPHAFKKYYVRK